MHESSDFFSTGWQISLSEEVLPQITFLSPLISSAKNYRHEVILFRVSLIKVK
jgi:hypothetical protein